MSAAAWYRDRAARSLIVFGYLPWLAGLSLVWERLHVPLYTLWKEAEPAYIAFSVVHCTLGDVLIGAAALLLALILVREGALERWRWPWIAALTVLFGTVYTLFSEWMNITVLRSWTYAASMPTVELGRFEMGLSPLLQWLVVPPLALYLARRRCTSHATPVT
ncbi:MAG TPA: hypothetical protein VMN03_12565 [Burkholderiales bacterium]|nr:hypothetical protein [Burkholderiales bacterium]